MSEEMPGHFDPKIMELFLRYDSEFESVRTVAI
jgi:HD-GYP domain-containing protein (c-di-GMP phosphodiesterase class II)